MPWCLHAEEAGGERWADVEGWCSAVRDDMREVADVFVFHTRVRHRAQPRTFAGALGLPPDRFAR